LWAELDRDRRVTDDMKVYIELSDVQCAVKLQDVFNLIDMWAADWQLQISVTKTNILNIGSTEHAVDYKDDDDDDETTTIRQRFVGRVSLARSRTRQD